MDPHSAQSVLEYAVPARRLRDPVISVRAGLSVILPMLHFLVFNYFKIDSDSFGLVVDGLYPRLNFAVNLGFYVCPFILFIIFALHSLWKHKPPLSPVSRYVAYMGIVMNIIAGASQVVAVYTAWYGYLL